MKYKNIRKIKNFNNELCNNNIINNDIFLLSNENFLNLYNIYNIDDLYNYVKKIYDNSLNDSNNNIQIQQINQFFSLKTIFECWIFNNIKILKKHDSYFVDICLFIIENAPEVNKYYDKYYDKKNLLITKKYISKLLQAYIYTIEYPESGYTKYPIIPIHKQFIVILFDKIINNLLYKS